MHVGWGGGKRKLDRLSINTPGEEKKQNGWSLSRRVAPPIWDLPAGGHPEHPSSQCSCRSLEHS